MKITILSYGNWGEVRPYIALALGIKNSGHEVILAAPAHFETEVTRHGLTCASIAGGAGHALTGAIAKNNKQLQKNIIRLHVEHKAELRSDTLAACANAQAVIAGHMMELYAATITEKLGIPFLLALINPEAVITSAFTNLQVRSKPYRSGVLNRRSFRTFFNLQQKYIGALIKEWRAELDMPPIKGLLYHEISAAKTPVIYGYSETLLPRPHDWGSHIMVSGNWIREEKRKKPYIPPADLKNWLVAGPTPVYVRLCGLPLHELENLEEMIGMVCMETGTRAIIHTERDSVANNLSGLNALAYFIQTIDLAWIFPQCSVIIHPGDMLTSHLSMELGVPSLVCSMFTADAFWGERIKALQAGGHIRNRKLTKNGLIMELARLEKPAPRVWAKQLADKMKTENGLQKAVDFINTHFGKATDHVVNEPEELLKEEIKH